MDRGYGYDARRGLIVRRDKWAAYYHGFDQLATVVLIHRKVRHAQLLSG